jgi:hypothetical protein
MGSYRICLCSEMFQKESVIINILSNQTPDLFLKLKQVAYTTTAVIKGDNITRVRRYKSDIGVIGKHVVFRKSIRFFFK